MFAPDLRAQGCANNTLLRIARELLLVIQPLDMPSKSLVTAQQIRVTAEMGRTTMSPCILKELDDLDLQARQLKTLIDVIEFEANDLENKIFSADIIRDNLKVFKYVCDHLTHDEKYDLLHLIIKKVVYFEEPEQAADGKKVGKIKMDLWELPPINPSVLNSAKGFAESNAWLPGADSNHGPDG